jgi:hypothetical protein
MVVVKKSKQGDPTLKYDSTARNIAEHDPLFKAACAKAGVQPTKRQAAKWRRGEGSAFANRG